MQERINEIIQFLMREISRLSDPFSINIKKLSERLLEKGYTKGEINKAFEWVVMNLEKNQLPPDAQSESKRKSSVRILSNEELNFFSAEAYGYLIQLQALNIVNALQVEHIIERCFMLGLTRIDVEDVKNAVSQIILGKEVGGLKTNSVYHPGNDRIN